MALRVGGLRLGCPAVRLSAKPVLGPWLPRATMVLPRAPWQTRPALAHASLLPHSGAEDRRAHLMRSVAPVRGLASSQSAATDTDAASSFSAMTVAQQRIDGVRWRIFGTVPDHAGVPGTKKLRKKLAGPSVLSWCAPNATISHPESLGGEFVRQLKRPSCAAICVTRYPSTLEDLKVPLYKEKGQAWKVRRKCVTTSPRRTHTLVLNDSFSSALSFLYYRETAATICASIAASWPS